MKNKFVQKNFGVLASVAIHLVILLVLLAIKIDWQVTIPEFIEIQFQQGGIPQQLQAAEPSIATNGKAVDEFELPQRRPDSPDLETVRQIDNTKLLPREKITAVDHTEVDDKIYQDINSVAKPGTKESPTFSDISKLSPEITSEIGSLVESPYKIEGKAALRTIVMKSIPQYPENFQQEATIKIRFTVLPNGLIGEMIPLIKSNDLLEKITLEALKQWRFNPLPPSVPQVTEQGTITFRYLLK